MPADYVVEFTPILATREGMMSSSASMSYLPQIAHWYKQVALPRISSELMQHNNGVKEFEVTTFYDRLYGPRVRVHMVTAHAMPSFLVQVLLRPDVEARHPFLNVMHIIPTNEDVSVEVENEVEEYVHRRAHLRKRR